MKIEVANNMLSRILGLMFRKDFSEVLVIAMPYESRLNGIHTCFMRFPIDVYFLNSHLDLVDKKKNLKPWLLGVYPKKPARYIVEVKSGKEVDLENVKSTLKM